MRGRILQYNGNDGTGVIVADGQQYRFTITEWKSDTPPTSGKTVDVDVNDGSVQTVRVVGDDVLLREKTSELTGKLGGMVGSFGGSMKSGEATASIVTRYGVPLLASFAVFLIATLFLNAFTMQIFGAKQGSSLYNLSNGLGSLGGSGGGGVKLLLVLAYLSIAVPFFWADKRAWLALLLPLLAVLWGMLSMYRATADTGPVQELFSYGFGMYLSVIAAVVIAVIAYRRYKTIA